MGRLTLKANNHGEKRVLKYLEENASETLVEKINSGDKTLKGFFDYAQKEARKLASGNCVCVDDETVFGWAIHYFEEGEIKGKETVEKKDVVKKAPKPQKEAKFEQLGLF